MIDANTHVRSITFESGYYLFLPIQIQRDCCICSKCIVVAGSYIPENTVMGPLSSSYDINKGNGSTDKKWRHYCRESFKSPPLWMKYCIVQPFLALYAIYSTLPILVGIYLMLQLVELTKLNNQFGTDSL